MTLLPMPKNHPMQPVIFPAAGPKMTPERMRLMRALTQARNPRPANNLFQGAADMINAWSARKSLSDYDEGETKREDARRDAYRRIAQALSSGDRQGALSIMGQTPGMQEQAIGHMMSQKAAERQTAKDVNGRLRYLDTGEMAFPDAAAKAPKLPPGMVMGPDGRVNFPPGYLEALRRQRTAGGATSEMPSSVREYEYWKNLPSDEERSHFVTLQRNPTYLNLGDRYARPNQMDPSAPPVQELARGLPPEQTPEVRAAQTAAVEGAKAVAEQAKKGQQAQRAIGVMEGVEDLIDQSSGGLLESAYDTAAGAVGHATTGAKAIAQLKVVQSQLMLDMPRMEGPQSDRDVNLYREAAGQIGDPTVPREIRKAAVQTIRELKQRYAQNAPRQMPTPLPNPTNPLGNVNAAPVGTFDPANLRSDQVDGMSEQEAEALLRQLQQQAVR